MKAAKRMTEQNNMWTRLIDLPNQGLRAMVERPVHALVVALLLLLAGSHYRTPLQDDLSSMVTDLGFDITAILLLGVLWLTKQRERLSFPEQDVFRRLLDTEQKRRLAMFAGLGALFLLALGLRLIKLSFLDPYTDENAHLMNAHNLRIGAPVSYERAPWLNGLVFLLWKIADPVGLVDHLYWARFPGAIVGAATIFPLFLLARRVSTPVAYLSCLLFAISPWAIGVSRYAREYAYFPFFILLVLLAFFKLMDALAGVPKIRVKPVLAYGVAILLFAVYALAVDAKSTARVGFILLAGAFIGGLLEYMVVGFEHGSAKRQRITGIVVLGVTAAAILIVGNASIRMVNYQINHRYLSVFLSTEFKTPLMWWSGYAATHIMSLFILVGAIAQMRLRNYRYVSLLTAFLAGLFFFYLFFDRYFSPRYSVYVLPVFTIIVAAGVWETFRLVAVFKTRVGRMAALVAICLFLGSVFSYRNLSQVVAPQLTQLAKNKKKSAAGRPGQTGIFRVTGEYHQHMRSAAGFLKDKVGRDDVFITTVFQPLLTLELGIPTSRIRYYPFKNKNPVAWVKTVMEKHRQGWMILDKRRNGMLVRRRFGRRLGVPITVGPADVTLVFDRYECQIFRWSPSTDAEKNALGIGRLPSKL